MSETLCGNCGLPTKGYSGLRYFGTFVAHAEHDCLWLLKSHLQAAEGKSEEIWHLVAAWRRQAEEIATAYNRVDDERSGS